MICSGQVETLCATLNKKIIGRNLWFAAFRGSIKHWQHIGKRSHNFADDFVLNGKDIFDVTIKSIRPNVFSVACVNQLYSYAHTRSRAPYAAFGDEAYAQFACRLPNVKRLAFVSKSGVPGNDEQSRNF